MSSSAKSTQFKPNPAGKIVRRANKSCADGLCGPSFQTHLLWRKLYETKVQPTLKAKGTT